MSKNKWLAAGAVVFLLAGGGIVATTYNPQGGSFSEAPAEGGQWEHGSSAGRTWSHFLHDQSHGARIKGREDVDSGCVPGGEWARAQGPSRILVILGDEQEYYLC
ncbi:lactococcin 972 family bacteriocin [Corynebacterium uterequi]|uniref:lactococcin 972 family bacteriocin n=1 Tax=Corynebacterium uterequi TaxID=1072256 RepID=UPI0009E3B4B0